MENYEERYKEALKKAKYYHHRDNIQFLEQIFPELRESEDERIRKGLIEHLKELKEQSVEGSYLKRPEYYDTWIAWLEKQGETNTEDFGEFINELSKQFPEVSFAKLSRIAVRVKKWLEKKTEQKSWCEEDDLIRTEAIYFINEFQKSDRCINENDMQNSVTCENWLKTLKPQYKQE